MADFIAMTDIIITGILYIWTVSKNETTIEKILAHLFKWESCDKSWSTERVKELLSDMTIDRGYMIKQNEAQDDNDNKVQFR